MCNLSDYVEQKGIAKGMAEGIARTTLSSIQNLMETLGLTVEQAMAALKVPESERPNYVKQMEK